MLVPQFRLKLAPPLRRSLAFFVLHLLHFFVPNETTYGTGFSHVFSFTDRTWFRLNQFSAVLHFMLIVRYESISHSRCVSASILTVSNLKLSADVLGAFRFSRKARLSRRMLPIHGRHGQIHFRTLRL